MFLNESMAFVHMKQPKKRAKRLGDAFPVLRRSSQEALFLHIADSMFFVAFIGKSLLNHWPSQ
jgi:hypothetical protein